MIMRTGVENKPINVSQQKPVAFFDLDDTMYRGLIMEALVLDQIQEGLVFLGAVPAILESIQGYQSRQRGQTSNVCELNSRWADGCKGINYNNLLSHAKKFVSRNKDNFHRYTEPVINLLKKKGFETWLSTGEPDYVAQAVKEEYTLTGFCATEWKRDKNSIITGGIRNPMTSKLKGEWARILLNPAFGCNNRISLAFVDSLNDQGLVEAAQVSIVCGQPAAEFDDYLKSCGKTYKIISPEQPEDVINFIDTLTR
ncbi:hypothetical protein HYU95_00990 [Candidatus Daviesbacteria bacterium]|nr:hypothetical protein [Candidatus Daviesbacteria bacterium]